MARATLCHPLATPLIETYQLPWDGIRIVIIIYIVAAWMCERAPQISIGSKACDTCGKKLSKEPPVFIPEPDSPNSDAEAEIYVQTPEVSKIIT